MLGVASISSLALADETAPLPDVVVIADRIAEPITATGSSITVLPGSQVAKWGTQGITKTLREAVGVEVTQRAERGRSAFYG